MRRCRTRDFAGPRSQTVTVTLRSIAPGRSAVSRSFVPKGYNQEAAVSLSGSKLSPLAMSLPR